MNRAKSSVLNRAVLLLTLLSMAADAAAQTLTMAAAQAAPAQRMDEQFVTGLRARRLFRLAERYCQEQVQRGDLSERQRANLLIELARTYGEHALHAAPEERAALWNEAHQVIADYQQAFPDSPALPLVRLQDALTWLAQGELARQEAEVGAGDAQLLEEARGALRKAASGLEEVAETLEVALRNQARRGSREQEELSAEELASLEKNVDYQLARAYRNQAESYPPGSPDRANSLTQALEQLERLAQLSVADEMVWRARIDEVVCYRLLGDVQRATAALARLVAAEPPPKIAFEAQAEKIRLLLAAQRLDEALQTASQGRAAAGQISPLLDLAQLEAFVAAWQAASAAQDQAGVERWQKLATAHVQQIEHAHGPYWMRRAELLLGRSVRNTAGADVEALARAAASFYRSGQVAEALATYDRASLQAREEGAAERAFELAFTAGAIEHDRKRHTDALQRFQELAHAQRTHPRAGEAHRLAIVNAAVLARASQPEQRAAWLDRYQQMLEEHLAIWPRDASTDAVRIWLGDWQRTQRNWSQAVAAYRGVSPEHEAYEAAIRQLADCYERWLAQLEAAGEPREQLAAEAAGQFLAVIAPQGQAAARLAPLDRFATLAAARIQLQHLPTGPTSAERLLKEALQRTPDAPPEWQSEAATLLVYALAAQGRHAEAAQVMEQISAGSATGLATMLAALTELAATVPADSRRALAELQLRVVALLQPRQHELQGDELVALEVGQAAALAASGRTAEALQAYERLAKKYPRNGNIQLARAALLQASNDPATLRTALAHWREIEKKSRPGGERWFTARFSQAETLYQLQEKEQAAKLIKLTRILHPEMGGAELKGKFERLLGLCEQRD